MPKNIVPPPRPPDNGGEGESLKRHALDRLEACRGAHIRRGCRALLAALLRHGSATIDDARAAVPLPPTLNPKLFGAVPGPLVEAGIIATAGFVPSQRRQAHARPVRRWLLADRAGALAWLAAHPDLADAD
jgi:hypothetical protein